MCIRDRRVAGGHEPGQRVEGGIKIKKGKLRGVESDGMMCSIEELGSNREMYPEAPEYGIYIFDDDAVVGESAIKSLGLDDVVVEYEITSNRVDCFSVVGIAREAAATFNKAFYPPVVLSLIHIFSLLKVLEETSGREMPQAIKDILNANILHDLECDADKMKDTVKNILEV